MRIDHQNRLVVVNYNSENFNYFSFYINHHIFKYLSKQSIGCFGFLNSEFF